MSQVVSPWARQSCLVSSLERFATLFEKEPVQPKKEEPAAEAQKTAAAK